MEDREQTLGDLFREAVELAGPARAKFVERSTRGDPELRARLERLLELDASGEASLAEGQLLDEVVGRLAELPCERIAGYSLVRLLGHGGMGAVYEAQQENPRRTVALKVIRRDLVTPDLLRRFRLESEVLGRLHHPGIAEIYQAGIAGSGDGGGAGQRPYFAMELVRGLPLTDFARERGLGVRERLELMARIADAVHHAHQMGVIHRDLKPANILVDTEGRPKVLDFGVARCTDAEQVATSLETATGQLVGTLPYMSPEQVGADARDTDVRADVYALGVILYELLAGRLPIDVTGRPIPDATLAILHDEPRRLGTVDTRYRGDIETIVRCALDKDRARRYESAAALAADLRRHLERQPIVARPATTTYLVRKFAARHPGLVAGAATTVLVLVAGVLVSSVQAIRARSAEEELARELSSVKQLSDLQDLEDLLAEAEDLWPAWPHGIDELLDWRERAEQLVSRLPTHRASRDALRALALPARDEDRALAGEDNLERLAIAEKEREVQGLELRLRARRDGVAAELPEPDWSVLPRDEESLIRMGWVLDPNFTGASGPHGLAAVASLRGLEIAPLEMKLEFLPVVCDAYLELGRDEEALDLTYATLEEVTGTAQEVSMGEYLEELEQRVERARSPEGLAQLEAGLEAGRAELAELRRALERGLAERREWRFAEENDSARWWNNQLGKLIEGLEALADPESGLLGGGISPGRGWKIERRLDEARSLEEGFAPGGPYARRWIGAATGIVDAYPGLQLAPQMGLVPLGPDPGSGLWEFWHVQSGAEPRRGEDGRWALTDDTGIVLVLLPGGTYWMGATRAPGTPAFVPTAVGNEWPVHLVELSPFFVSKYEMTQGQWLRAAGRNPSEWKAGARGPGPYTLRNPVEQVSWNECRAAMTWLGLELPTEAQWEYACRGGTETPFSWPEDADPAEYANVADRAYTTTFSAFVPGEDWSDGGAATMPVGSYLPNPFGLHDVHGNVFETCRDGLDDYHHAKSRRRDPVAPALPGEPRVSRGGSFDMMLDDARSALRTGATPNSINISRGLRPARAVHPAGFGFP